jgi:hypothetical protein
VSLVALLVGLLPLPDVDSLRVAPGLSVQACSAHLGPFTFEVDNSASTVEVAWSATAVETLSDGTTPWATLQPSQGTLKAGERATVDVVPNAVVCQVLAHVKGGAGAHAVAAYMARSIATSVPATTAYHVQVTSTGKTHRIKTLTMSLTNDSAGATPSPTLTDTPTVSPTVTPTVTPPVKPTVTPPVKPPVKPTITPTATYTATPTLHGNLALSPGALALGSFCGDAFSGASITLANTGNGLLTWQPPSGGGITLSPAGGQLSAGSSVSVGLSGTKSNTSFAITWLDGGQGSPKTQAVSLSCVTKVVNFKITPPTNYFACGLLSPPVPNLVLTLDNTGSNVAVGWQITAREAPDRLNPNPNNIKWAYFDAVGGSVPAGKTAQVTIKPYYWSDSDNLCWWTSPSDVPYHAVVTLTSGGAGTFTFTYTVRGTQGPL